MTGDTSTEMEDSDAVSGLKRLGLTTYEARVFVALQRLGQGSASKISEVSEVPRSQVYGAADGLEQRGLVETQQSTPTVYRPVPLEQARRLLLDQLAETGTETFDYLETVQHTHKQEERTESIWLLNGADAIKSRALDLIESADERVLYAIDEPEQLDEETLAALEAVGTEQTAILASVDPAVFELVPNGSAIETYQIPDERDLDVSTSRVLIVDTDTLLLSTYSAANNTSGEEVAFWTSENIFADVMVELVDEWFRQPF